MYVYKHLEWKLSSVLFPWPYLQDILYLLFYFYRMAISDVMNKPI